MIRPDSRVRLTPQDVALVLETTTGVNPSAEDVDVMLADLDLDELLDRPEVAERMSVPGMPGPSPALFFYVLVRRALVARGVDDRILADYCAALLREFGRGTRAWRVAEVDDHDHRYLVDILADASTAPDDRRYRVYVHLGNYSLWFAGVFPERIAALRARRGGPDLGYYDALGGRGYAQASDHWLAGRSGMQSLFRVAADRFTELRTTLNEVSERWC